MQSKGICKYCGKEYTRGGMLRHLAACKTREAVLVNEKAKTKCGYFPVCNSPRMGVCGYERSVRYDDQFAADEIKK